MMSLNRLCQVVVFGFLVGSCLPGFARPIFGPEIFTRDTGAPNEFRETFPFLGSASTIQLMIQNGRQDGSDRVSSAWIWLNGEQILNPSDFNQQVFEIRTPISLSANNDIKIRLAGKPGGFLTVSISAVVGPAGGFVTTPAGARLTIPSGAVNSEITVGLDDLPLADTGITLPQNFTFVRGVSIDLGNVDLTSEADLAIPVNFVPVDRLILARILQFGEMNRLALTDTASLKSDGFIHTNSPPFPGVRTGGSYMFVQVSQDLGILSVNVRGGDGKPVNNAVVSAFVTQIGSAASAGSIEDALASDAIFVGQTDSVGFAAIPTAAPSTTMTIIASAPSSTTQTLIGMASVTLPPAPFPLFPAIVDSVTDVIVDHLFPGTNPPQQIQPCECTVLAVPSLTDFTTGNIQRLAVHCGLEDVTVSPSPLDLSTLLGAGGISNFTLYLSENTDVATVDQFGQVTAVASGKAAIHVFHYRVQAIPFNGIFLFQQCDAVGTASVIVKAVLAVVVTGSGNGTISSSSGGIVCPGVCSARFDPGTQVTLTASPASSSLFSGWTGDCNGNQPSASLTLTSDKNCTATFSLAQAGLTISVALAGNGTGNVQSFPSGINCGGGGTVCTANFPIPAGAGPGASVTLFTTPGTGSFFESWTGCSSVDLGFCDVLLHSNTHNAQITATFLQRALAITSVSCNVTPGANLSNVHMVITAQATGGIGFWVTDQDFNQTSESCGAWSGPTGVFGISCTRSSGQPIQSTFQFTEDHGVIGPFPFPNPVTFTTQVALSTTVPIPFPSPLTLVVNGPSCTIP